MKESNIITGIGSLPYDNIEDAVAYSMRHDIPFLPELPLPKHRDDMILSVLEQKEMSCLSLFKQKIKENNCGLVKVQCAGPWTLIGGYKENNIRRLDREGLDVCDDALGKIYYHLEKILFGLENKEVLLFLDEPNLISRDNYDELWQPIFDAFVSRYDIKKGVHTCGSADWEKMLRSNIDIISFNAADYDITPTIRRYFGTRNNLEIKNKKIAWGIKSIDDIKDWREGDLITLPCGMHPKVYSIEDCEKNLKMLIDVKTNIAKPKRKIQE